MPENSLIVQPGDLRKPLQLFTRSDTQDAAGGENPPTYSPLFASAVWAHDQHRKSTALDTAGKLVTATYHVYTVRFHPSIQAGTYIFDPDFSFLDSTGTYQKLMYVQGVVDPDGERHWMEITAEDVEG